jgi:PTS system cellobiose-specific IIA component
MTIMNIVVDSGSCRSFAMEAIAMAKEGNFEEAEKNIEEAEKEILKAHHSQTDLIQKEAAGEATEISLLLVHSQDHLMTAMLCKDLAKEFIELYRKI